MLRAYAGKLLRGTGLDPEDVVQDVFVRAHAALTGGDDRDLALKPWLYRMTRNRVIDVLRRRDRSSESLDAESAAEHAAPPSAEPAQAVGRREALRALLADLAELPEQQRDALLMRELEGLSHTSVAAELGVTPEASRMLVVRARENLVKSVVARDAACPDVRDDLAGAHDARRRPSEHARRHLRGCEPCQTYRAQLRGVRANVALMHPGPALLLALGAGKLGFLGFSSGGAKTVATVATAVAVTAGAAGVVIIDRPTLRAGDPAPRAVPGAKVVLGQTIGAGRCCRRARRRSSAPCACPRSSAERDVMVPLTCPPRYVAAERRSELRRRTRRPRLATRGPARASAARESPRTDVLDPRPAPVHRDRADRARVLQTAVTPPANGARRSPRRPCRSAHAVQQRYGVNFTVSTSPSVIA